MHFMQNHIVYLKDRFCSCGMFQLVGYPCCHAIAALDYHRLDVEGYIDDRFNKAVYMKVYSNMVNPVPGMHDYEDSGMGKFQPPDVVIKVGRPKKTRRRDANDVRENATASRKGLSHTCAICFSKGHNKRSCTNPPHPNSKFTQNPNQGRQRCSTSHAAAGSRRGRQRCSISHATSGSREGRQSPSAAEQPPFDEFQTYYSEMPPVFSQPSQEQSQVQEQLQFQAEQPQVQEAPSPTRTAQVQEHIKSKQFSTKSNKNSPNFKNRVLQRLQGSLLRPPPVPVASKASHLNPALEQVGPRSISTQEHFAKECPSQPPLPKAAESNKDQFQPPAKTNYQNKAMRDQGVQIQKKLSEVQIWFILLRLKGVLSGNWMI
ncbi:UNVERIFIED_CONTAM: hypothetical protein Slati_1937900 [Sesamum latifolium]|uniref:SWIM-type domain-containing protein n=1 Tax=Sesamum latifolium TaxID=2727402 RepID=A0AAW2X3F9_9LAMI